MPDYGMQPTAKIFKEENNFEPFVVLEEFDGMYEAFKAQGITLEQLPVHSVNSRTALKVRNFMAPDWFSGFYATLLNTYCTGLDEVREATTKLIKDEQLRKLMKSYLYFLPDDEKNLRPVIDLIIAHGDET